MSKIKNPQEFFEVFKTSGKEERPAPPSEPKEEAARPKPRETPPPPSAPAPSARTMPLPLPPRPRIRNAAVTVTPGQVTVTLSHTGLVATMAFLAGLMILSFCLGAQYAKKSRVQLTSAEERMEAAPASEKAAPIRNEMPPALDMTPAALPKPVVSSAPAASPAKAPAPKKPWRLQLISGIPKDKADAIAKQLSFNWETEVVGSGSKCGVRIGGWDSPNEANARNAQAFYKKEKQYSDCFFVKVD